ncbi:MAG: hypothetical protein FJX46_18280, partial [Alphaproteobacteria bacterium]|nr:hypothetical protein [Alphaproteobacteria bacterium]
MAEPEQREPSDEDLMSRIAGGDRRAFDLLIRRHLAGSVALAGRISGDRAAAEDVAHDAFLRLWRAAPG